MELENEVINQFSLLTYFYVFSIYNLECDKLVAS